MIDNTRDWRAFALLIIDVQKDFWSEDNACNFPDFPANIERLLHFCRTEGIDIVHIRAQFQADRSDWMAKYRIKGTIPCVAGTPGVEVLPFAQPQSGEPVLVKQTFDGFHIPALLPYLRDHNKQFILTAGLITSTCVFLTTASAAQQGFLTAIVEDGCADSPEAHAGILERYGFIFERTTVDQIPHHYDHWIKDLAKLNVI